MDEVRPAPNPESTKHLRTLANGAVYDMVKKRIVSNPGGGTTAITPETAIEYNDIQKQQKQEALRRAANAVAMQGGSVDGHALDGDLAFVEAIGEAMTMKALSVGDPKAVDAARFIFNETGISEKQTSGEQAGAQLLTAALNAEAAGALERVWRAVMDKQAPPDAINVPATDTRNE